MDHLAPVWSPPMRPCTRCKPSRTEVFSTHAHFDPHTSGGGLHVPFDAVFRSSSLEMATDELGADPQHQQPRASLFVIVVAVII